MIHAFSIGIVPVDYEIIDCINATIDDLNSNLND